jgi:uncharacterized membrane protein
MGSKRMIITKKRSLAKSLTWRIVAIIVTFATIYLLTGEIDTASAGTILANSVNFILYYFHERAWNNIGWGKENV